MHIVIQLFLYDSPTYNPDKERRVREFETALVTNLNNPKIQSVHALCVSKRALEHFSAVVNSYKEKAVLSEIQNQPTYKEIVEYIQRTFYRNELVCIMNSDIFFNTVRDIELVEKYMKPNYLFSLTRHEITNDGHTFCTANTCPFTVWGGSSDTFIFYTPIPSTLDTSKMDFKQNLFGAEARFMKPWADAGYEIWNPCDDIITLHIHHGRIHFEKYETIATHESSHAVINHKTTLPSSNRDI